MMGHKNVQRPSLRGLFIVDSDIDSLRAKGVLGHLKTYDEEGALEHLVFFHPFALHDQTVQLTPSISIREQFLPPPPSPRPVGWMMFTLHLVKSIIRASSFVLREKINFIRAHDPYYCGLIAYVTSIICRVPFCISLHCDYDKMDELDPTNGTRRIFGSRSLAKRLERFLLKRSDRVIGVSAHMARYGAKNGARASSLRILRHRLDLSAFYSDKVAHNTPPVISVISRLSAQKRIMDLPKIAEALRNFGVDFTFVVAGNGEAEAQIRQDLQDRGLEGQVQLLGAQSRSEVADLLARSDLALILCGGASLIETAASSCPIVAYDWEWHSEIVRDGDSGLLVPEGDCLEAAKSLAWLINNPTQAKEMGLQAKKSVMAMFDSKRLLETRRSIYLDLAGFSQPEPDGVFNPPMRNN